MLIDVQIWEKWTPVMEHGDATRIQRGWPKNEKIPHYQTIVKALKTRECSLETYKGIAAYYNNRLKELEAANEQ